MEPEIELLLMVLVVCSIACGMFYGVAFVVQRVRLLWIEIESNRIDMLAKRANVKIALDQNDLSTQVIRPDETGLLPVSRKMLDSGMTTEAALQIAMAYIEAQRTHAPVPHTLSRTYAPHIKQDKVAVAEPLALLEAPEMTPKDFFQLYQAGELPGDKFLIGYDLEDGQPVFVTWFDLYSCLIGGKSGTGKSTLIRSILAQSAMQGGKFLVIDRHFRSGSESLGESLSPLRSQMLRDVAGSERDKISVLKFVYETGERRLAGKDKDRTPLVLIVDETTAELERGEVSDLLIKVLKQIAQETRKVHVFAMCIGQNFSAEIMPSTARNSFAGMISCQARADVARVQSGNKVFGQMASGLRRGQAVISLGDDPRRIAFPNCTQQHLAAVGSMINATKDGAGIWVPTPGKHDRKHDLLPSPEASSDDDGSMVEASNEDVSEPVIMGEKEQRALAMFHSGKAFKDIIPAVWGVSAGRKYNEAGDYLQQVIRSQMGGTR